jgi:hypothetical protein
MGLLAFEFGADLGDHDRVYIVGEDLLDLLAHAGRSRELPFDREKLVSPVEVLGEPAGTLPVVHEILVEEIVDFRSIAVREIG